MTSTSSSNVNDIYEELRYFKLHQYDFKAEHGRSFSTLQAQLDEHISTVEYKIHKDSDWWQGHDMHKMLSTTLKVERGDLLAAFDKNASSLPNNLSALANRLSSMEEASVGQAGAVEQSIARIIALEEKHNRFSAKSRASALANLSRTSFFYSRPMLRVSRQVSRRSSPTTWTAMRCVRARPS